MRGENQNTLRFQYAVNLAKSLIARSIWKNAVYAIEGHHHGVERRLRKYRKVGSICGFELEIGKLFLANVDHFRSVVSSHIAPRDRREIGGCAPATYTQVQNRHSRSQILIKQQTLAGSEIVQRRIVGCKLRAVIGFKVRILR